MARALNSIDACSDLFVRNAPPSAEERRRARQGLRVLNRQYRRTPFGEFKLDESSPDPTTMQEVLKEVIYRTFDGPCPELARGANNELTHEARELDARAL